MDEFDSLSHSQWECKYHVVFIPKCRRKTLYEQSRRHLGELFRKLTEQKESRIEERVLSATPRNPGCAGLSRAAHTCAQPSVGSLPFGTLDVVTLPGWSGGGSVRCAWARARASVYFHPGRRIERHLGRVAQQGNEVVKRFGLLEFGHVDRGHEQITDARAVQRPLPISALNIYGDWPMV